MQIDCSVDDNGHYRSGGREITLDILFYLCSYIQVGIAIPKPSQKKEDQNHQKAVFVSKLSKLRSLNRHEHSGNRQTDATVRNMNRHCEEPQIYLGDEAIQSRAWQP
jgi:hypothetical protein